MSDHIAVLKEILLRVENGSLYRAGLPTGGHAALCAAVAAVEQREAGRAEIERLQARERAGEVVMSSGLEGGCICSWRHGARTDHTEPCQKRQAALAAWRATAPQGAPT